MGGYVLYGGFQKLPRVPNIIGVAVQAQCKALNVPNAWHRDELFVNAASRKVGGTATQLHPLAFCCLLRC